MNIADIIFNFKTGDIPSEKSFRNLIKYIDSKNLIGEIKFISNYMTPSEGWVQYDANEGATFKPFFKHDAPALYTKIYNALNFGEIDFSSFLFYGGLDLNSYIAQNLYYTPFTQTEVDELTSQGFQLPLSSSPLSSLNYSQLFKRSTNLFSYFSPYIYVGPSSEYVISETNVVSGEFGFEGGALKCKSDDANQYIFTFPYPILSENTDTALNRLSSYFISLTSGTVTPYINSCFNNISSSSSPYYDTTNLSCSGAFLNANFNFNNCNYPVTIEVNTTLENSLSDFVTIDSLSSGKNIIPFVNVTVLSISSVDINNNQEFKSIDVIGDSNKYVTNYLNLPLSSIISKTECLKPVPYIFNSSKKLFHFTVKNCINSGNLCVVYLTQKPNTLMSSVLNINI